ncbi:NAD-dependent epimerase/dehydratase family protein [uncultured Sphingomonas sp.]|uniref:NAD-dependent epimerase/dehydratase family protein n=1 Tax=uncultured Sphingomonas sp. TaxID=158754 RepID=UPI0035C97791
MGSFNILVTGGAGFIGSHLCEKLHRTGHQVWCLDDFSTGFRDNVRHMSGSPRFHLIEGDVRSALPDLPVDRIYNLACPASPRHYQSDPIGTMRTNVFGAINVLDLALRNGARVLQASTSEVYGDPEVHPQIETYVGAVNCTGPRACYDEGKRAAETLFFDYHREHGVSIRVARLFNSYGPRMSSGDGRVVPNFIDQALRGEPITVFGTGRQTRSFCYVTDTVDGLIRLMDADGALVGPVNLGNSDEFTVSELADLVIAKTGSTSKIIKQPLPEDDPKLRRPDIGKARTLLGWTPHVKLSDGLDLMIAAVRSDIASRPACAVGDGSRRTVAIIGGGPAGLTAAYVALTRGVDLHPIVLEADRLVGGIARTENYKGYRFDIGGHRFFTKVKPVEDIWKEVMPEEFLRRPRMSRIYYKDKFYAYPLKIFNALGNIGVYESARILMSYMKWRSRPHVEEDNFEQWVTNRFGGRLFWHFFKTYTEKVWGMPCTEIKADWAAQRIKNLSLRKAVMNAFTGANDTASLIEEFDYPRLGPGMMWEAMADRVQELDGEVRKQARVTEVRHDGRRISAICVEDEQGAHSVLAADEFISSMPITELIQAMNPPAPETIQAAAKLLCHRDFLIVTLILDDPDPFPDNWIYIHSPEVNVGRIQNFRSWSPDMVPDKDRSSIGMEYFCNQGDGIWTMTTEDLVAMAAKELEHLGLAKAASVVDGTVIRQPLAYPVYDNHYRASLDTLRDWLGRFRNLQMVGRNGMHRYNNQDHSMLTAMYAIENIRGAKHDLWSVNVDQTYHEDVEAAPRLQQDKAVA